MPISNPSYFPFVRQVDRIVGTNAGFAQTGDRVFLGGLNAGRNQGGEDLLVIGSSALAANAGGNATGTTALGSQALSLLGSGENTALGFRAAASLTTDAIDNVLLGAHVAEDFGASGLRRNVLIGKEAFADISGGEDPTVDNVVIGHAAMQRASLGGGTILTNSVVIGSSALEDQEGGAWGDLVVIGSGIRARQGLNSSVLLGAGIQLEEGGFRNIVIGFEALQEAVDPIDDTLVIGTSSGTLCFGSMASGNLILGRSSAGVDRDFAGDGATNILKLLDGTAGDANPVGGGYFYVDAAADSALHWVQADGTDTDLTAGGGGALLTAFKPADTARTSTTTATDDPDLAFAALEAGTYAIDGYLYVRSASATPDFKWGLRSSVAPPANAPFFGVACHGVNGINAAGSVTQIIATTVNAITVGLAVNEDTVLAVHATVFVASAFDLSVQWAQNTSDATATILKRGSWLRLQKLD